MNNDIKTLLPGEKMVSVQTEICYVVGRKRDCCKDQSNHKVINFDPVWRDGDVICKVCYGYVRGFDAG